LTTVRFSPMDIRQAGDPKTALPESANNQNTLGWDKRRQWQIPVYNPSYQSIGSLLFSELTYSDQGPLLTPLHIMNKMLIQGWDVLQKDKAANKPYATEYFKWGEHWSHREAEDGTVDALSRDNEKKHMIFCDARLFMQRYVPLCVQIGGDNSAGSFPDGPLTGAFSGSDFKCVNYWGYVPMGYSVGFILKRTTDGPYAMEPYVGQTQPTKEELMYKDAAGFQQFGYYLHVGKGQYVPKQNYYVKPALTNQKLLCGLAKSSPEEVTTKMSITTQVTLILNIHVANL
jgi:hypothetical protein